MSEKITEKNTEKKQNLKKDEERVPFFVDKDPSGDEKVLIVSVNGANYTLPRGQESLIPKHVAEEIRRSRRAQARLDKKMNALLELSKQPTNF